MTSRAMLQRFNGTRNKFDVQCIIWKQYFMICFQRFKDTGGQVGRTPVVCGILTILSLKLCLKILCHLLSFERTKLCLFFPR